MSLSAVGDSTESPELVLAPVDRLGAHPDNPRRSVGELRELVASVRAHGVLEPLIVVPADAFNAAAASHPVAVYAPAGVRWVVVAGHRRHAAAVKAGLAVVPVLPRPDLADPAAALEVMLVENVQRSALTPTEEARAFARLREAGRSQREIGARLGCAQSQVSKRLALLDLPERALAAVDCGRLAVSDAAEVLRLRKYPQDMAELVEELLGDGGPMWTGERLQAVVDGELQGIDGRENRRRLLAQAEARGARILDPAAGQLPPYQRRRPLHDPAEVDAAGQAGTLGAYVGGDGRVCYLNLTPSDADDEPGSVEANGEADDEAPEVVSGDGITVRRVSPDQPTDPNEATAAGAQPAEARRAAGAEREQREATRDEICQKLMAALAADPTTVLPVLAGHVLSDTAGDGFTYADTGRAEAWLTLAGVWAYTEDDEPEVFGWLDRTADTGTRLLLAAALALAAAERRLTEHAAYSGWDVHDLAHLDRLVAAGHTLSEWEQAHADRVHTRCTRTEGCGEPYGHPLDDPCVVEPDAAEPATG
jgi:ParB/RepB/Spo0J family partition protein